MFSTCGQMFILHGFKLTQVSFDLTSSCGSWFTTTFVKLIIVRGAFVQHRLRSWFTEGGAPRLLWSHELPNETKKSCLLPTVACYRNNIYKKYEVSCCSSAAALTGAVCSNAAAVWCLQIPECCNIQKMSDRVNRTCYTCSSGSSHMFTVTRLQPLCCSYHGGPW